MGNSVFDHYQKRRQATLARMEKRLNAETRIRNLTTAITLRSLYGTHFSRFNLRVFSDSIASARGQTGIGTFQASERHLNR